MPVLWEMQTDQRPPACPPQSPEVPLSLLTPSICPQPHMSRTVNVLSTVTVSGDALARARAFQAFSPGDSPLHTPSLHTPLPGLLHPAPSGCRLHTSTARPTGHLTPPSLAPRRRGRGVQPRHPGKAVVRGGPGSHGPIRERSQEPKHASSVPLKPKAPHPDLSSTQSLATLLHTPPHPPPSSGVPARVSIWDAGGERKQL